MKHSSSVSDKNIDVQDKEPNFSPYAISMHQCIKALFYLFFLPRSLTTVKSSSWAKIIGPAENALLLVSKPLGERKRNLKLCVPRCTL